MHRQGSTGRTALVTGGAGFIGMQVANHLIDGGVAVTLVDDFSRGQSDDAFGELLERATLVEHDLTEPLPAGLAAQRFSTVFHFAALVGVRNVARAPEEVLRVNLRSTLNLLDWCSRQRPETFFLSSTSEIADGARELTEGTTGGAEDGPFVAAEPMLPRSSYAVSKLSCELLVAHYARRHGFRARIGRYHNVYGPRMGYDHVIPELMQRAHARLDPFPVWSVDHTRAFCYIDDAVAATLAVMELDAPEPLVVNLGDDSEEVSIGRLAAQVLELTGHDPQIEPCPSPPGSPPRRLPDLRRLRQLTDWRATTSLDEGLARTWDWYAADLDRPRVAQ